MRRRCASFAFFVLLLTCAGCGSSHNNSQERVGAVLTYEIDEADKAGQPPVAMEDLLKIANRRVIRGGKAKAIDEKQFAVELYSPVEEFDIQQTKDVFKSTGFLEFRVLADRSQRRDRSVIEAAEAVAPTTKKIDLGGSTVAEWVQFDAAKPDWGYNLPDSVARKAGNADELLVLVDPFDVTGKYVSAAFSKNDERNGPAIVLSFDKEGAKRMKMLTTRNLPNPAVPNLHRKLGIILDKKLLSAPLIQTAISNNALISGGAMTKGDVDRIGNVLQAGAFPCAVRLVGEKRID